MTTHGYYNHSKNPNCIIETRDNLAPVPSDWAPIVPIPRTSPTTYPWPPLLALKEEIVAKDLDQIRNKIILKTLPMRV